MAKESEITPTVFDENSKEYRKNIYDFLQIKAIHELEGRPLDAYENHLLLFHATGKISKDKAREAFDRYIEDGTKLIK